MQTNSHVFGVCSMIYNKKREFTVRNHSYLLTPEEVNSLADLFQFLLNITFELFSNTCLTIKKCSCTGLFSVACHSLLKCFPMSSLETEKVPAVSSIRNSACLIPLPNQIWRKRTKYGTACWLMYSTPWMNLLVIKRKQKKDSINKPQKEFVTCKLF